MNLRTALSNRYTRHLLEAAVLVAGMTLVPARPVQAQVCYPQRTINQYRCTSLGSDPSSCDLCIEYQTCNIGTTCCRTSTTNQEDADQACEQECGDVYGGTGCANGGCTRYDSSETCTSWTCRAESYYADCTDPPDCQAVGKIIKYQVVESSESCKEIQQTHKF